MEIESLALLLHHSNENFCNCQIVIVDLKKK
jgi:hypothetical protein